MSQVLIYFIVLVSAIISSFVFVSRGRLITNTVQVITSWVLILGLIALCLVATIQYSWLHIFGIIIFFVVNYMIITSIFTRIFKFNKWYLHSQHISIIHRINRTSCFSSYLITSRILFTLTTISHTCVLLKLFGNMVSKFYISSRYLLHVFNDDTRFSIFPICSTSFWY